MHIVVPGPRSRPVRRAALPRAGAAQDERLAGLAAGALPGGPADMEPSVSGGAEDDQPFALIERNPQPMFVFERATLRIIAASAAATRAYGYTHDELLGMSLRDLIATDELPRFDEFYRAQGLVEAPGLLPRNRRRHRRKDGSEIVVETTSDDLVYRRVPCRILVCEDVAELEQAAADLAYARAEVRAGEERYRLLFERNPQPMAVYDLESFEFIAVNDAMVSSYGYSREELIGMSGLDLLVAEDVGTVRDYLASNPGPTPAAAGWKGWRHRRKDGTIIDIETAGDDLTFDGRECRLALFQDVTERNRAAAELAVARDQALRASSMKSAFLANMSHEIRTPMNGVIGLTELLLDMGLTAKQHETAQLAADAGEQLLAIINDILDVSKIEAGQLRLDPTDFDPRELIEQTCSVAGLQADKRGVHLGCRIDAALPTLVHGDAGRVRQILANLVSNAAKFTGNGSVTVDVQARPDSVVHVEVTDTGIGIDPQVLEHMFEPFTQADPSTTRHYGGTGLGLTISRQLVELMGGTIGARSQPGHGSTFWFELRLDAADPDTPTPSHGRDPPATDTPTPSNGRDPPATDTHQLDHAPIVLVVDDNLVNQTVAVRTLERCGFRAAVAADGRQALDALQTAHYDAVLMDCQMPGMNGYEATIELRRRENGADRHIPVIAMTASAMTGDHELCLQAGMDDYITKPIRRPQLTQVLNRWITATKTP